MGRQQRILALPLFLWFFFLVAGPFALILLTSFFRRTELGQIEPAFSFAAYQQLFDPLYAEILLRTLVMALANTFITVLIAYPIAFTISRLSAKWRIWIMSLILIPFWTNFLLRVLAFMEVLRLHPFGLDLVYTSTGVLGALVYNYLPFAILPLYSVMEKVQPALLEAARDLGASKRQVFFRVIWPLTSAGVYTAALLVFIPSLGEFLIPEIVGGSKHFMLGSFLHHQFMTARNWPLGSAAIVFLLLISFLFLSFSSARNKGALWV